MRTAKARRMLSAIRCTALALCQPRPARSYVASCCAMSASVIPPDDGGGIAITSWPRYWKAIGVRHFAS